MSSSSASALAGDVHLVSVLASSQNLHAIGQPRPSSMVVDFSPARV